MQKAQAKSEAERARAREEAVVEIDMTQAMVVSEKEGKAKKGGAKGNGAVEVDAAYAPSDDEGSETDDKGPTAFKQRELVAMAFAGDNVVEVSDCFIIPMARIAEVVRCRISLSKSSGSSMRMRPRK